MTIDEAIKHCLEVAEENDLAAGTYEILAENNHNAYERLTAETNSLRCAECAADLRQLAEWLRELRKAKRLLGEALRMLNDGSCNKDCRQCKWNENGCEMSCRFAWKYGDEVSALIGDDNDAE